MPLAHTRHSMPSTLPSSIPPAHSSTSPSSSSSHHPTASLTFPSSSSSSSSSSLAPPLSKYHLLRRLLTKVHYAAPCNAELLLSSCPPSLSLPILSHLFLAYSPHLTHYFLSHNFLLSSSSFSLSSLYLLLLHLFNYRPPLSQQQFSTERGYVSKKLTMICDIIALCIAKHDELARKAEAEAPRGGVPRVASLARAAHSDEQQRDSHAEQQRQGRERRTGNAQPKEDQPKRNKERPTRRKSDALDRDELREALADVDATPLHPQHISFTSPSTPPLSPLSSLSSPQPAASSSFSAARDPLVSLHSQLQAIAQRTSHLSPGPSSSVPSLEEVMRRLEVVEGRVDEEVRGLQERLADLTQRLSLIEQRSSPPPPPTVQPEREEKAQVQGEEVKEAAVVVEVKERERETEREAEPVVRASDTSDFLHQMQARLAATASLIDNARRMRRGEAQRVSE